MNKKVIFIFVIVLILVGGGFFWWQEDKIERFLERKTLEKIVAPSKDYAVVEDFGEKFIINKKDGFKAKIPSGWGVLLGDNMQILESFRKVTLYSKDFSYIPPQGCLIEIQINRVRETRIEEHDGALVLVMYPFEGSDEVKEMINDYKKATLEEKEEMQEKGIEIISVDRKEAIQETRILNTRKHITIKIPTENKVYIFRNAQLSELCDEELKQFLETVSIK